jgi:hypothetical protein
LFGDGRFAVVHQDKSGRRADSYPIQEIAARDPSIHPQLTGFGRVEIIHILTPERLGNEHVPARHDDRA